MMKIRYALSPILALWLTACERDEQPGKSSAAPIKCPDGARYNERVGVCEPSADPNDVGALADMAATPGMVATSDMEQPAGGTLVGKITRSIEPRSGGKGGLYVAIFERNPITDMNNPGLVARTFIPNADMSAAGASYDYTLGPILPRAEAYYITAFLDDNNTVDMNDPSNAGPDRGDLVSLNGFSFPTVMVTQPSQQTLDIVLNIALPF